MEHKFNYRWNFKDTTFTKDKGKVFSCFSCCGGSTMGYKLAGFDVIGCNEIDPRMLKVYVENHHPKYTFLEGIQTFKERDDIPEELYNLDILDGSPPCFAAGTLVLTSEGYKPIEEIQIGDMVYTHNGRFRKVYNTMNHVENSVLKLNIKGSLPIYCTKNHPFYVSTMMRKGHVSKRTYSEPSFVNAGDLSVCRTSNGSIKSQSFCSIALPTECAVPNYEGISFERTTPHGGKYIDTYNSINVNDESFWKLVGRYLGDGWLRKTRSTVIICCSFDEYDELKQIIEDAGFHALFSKERTVYKAQISSIELHTFLKQFGHGAMNKHLNKIVFELPINLQKALLDGYISADGYTYNKSGEITVFGTISKNLAYGFEFLVANIYHTGCTITKRINNTNIIEGRKVNIHESYSVSFRKNINHKREHGLYSNGYYWTPFRDSEVIEGDTIVYNISVEEDETYTVNNIVVHNCSTFSLAGSREDAWGKMKKFREGQAEQVLDTLFFDFIDLAKKLQPKIVIAENVKGMLIGNAKKYVDRIVEEFDKAGYYCVYNLLSGLDMGVPQKRERVFFTCIRKDLIEYIPYEENLFCEKVPIIKLRFDEKPVPYGEIKDGLGPDINPAARKLWEKRKPGQKSLGDVLKEEEGRDSYFNYTFAFDDEPVNTITAHRESNIVYDTGKFLSNNEVILASTFPLDYNFMTDVNSNITYVCGMSVPPVMMANVASNVYEQWLKPIKEKSGE